MGKEEGARRVGPALAGRLVTLLTSENPDEVLEGEELKE
jgi:hypothetical protein